MKYFLTIVMLTLFASANTASAGYTYNIHFNPSSAAGATGGPIPIDVILDETSDDLIGSPLKLSDPLIALTGASIRVTVNPGGSGAIALQSVSNLPAGFDVVSQGTVISPTEGTIELSSFLPAGAGSTTVSGNTASLRLGTFTFLGLFPGLDTLTVAPFGNLGGDIVLGDGTALDGIATFSPGFVAVPEPTSIATMSLLAVAGGWFARRRKKNTAA